MSATPPSRSPSPSVEPDEAHSPPPPSIQPDPKTPQHKARLDPGTTPVSLGTSALRKQDGDTGRVDGYCRGDYDNYVREDLKSRVFVDFEVFMKYVLHAPHDWDTRWKSAIEAIEADPDFKTHHGEYCKRCESETQEKQFYKPLMETANAALHVLSHFPNLSPGIPKRYHVNDPMKVQGGVMNKTGLSPDLVVLHKDCTPSEGGNIHWANPLHVLEVKPFDSAICDGANMPRLVVDDVDPILNHAKPPTPLRYKAKKTTTGSVSGSSRSKKRGADEPPTTSRQSTKKSKTIGSSLRKTVGKSGSAQNGGESEGRSTPKPETQSQVDPAMQVCRYLLEMFSVPLLRSHATASLVDRDRLQLYHANHSVILVSSAVNFSKGDGLKKFIANIIALHLLSFQRNGILDTLIPGNTELVRGLSTSKSDGMIQEGNVLEFTTDGGEKFTVTLTDVISRDPATVGRSTAVVGATSDRWSKQLAIKASWPSSTRVSEADFLKKAIDEAKKPENEWAINHLPDALFSKDIDSDQDPTLKSVADLFDIGVVVNGELKYERRTLRVIIQERLYPLKSLSKVKDIGQVFLDIACIHRWLHDKPGILHRDLSLNNIMFRIIENKEGEAEVYGVLTDYDLSSWTASLKTDYTKTSQQRTGTPPYMAQELLKGTSNIHLYRHDAESLFYIILMVCGRHTIGRPIGGTGEKAKEQVVMRKEDLPYEDWYNERSYTKLGKCKTVFFSDMEPIELSPTFEDFRPWLNGLQYCFSDGFGAKSNYAKRKARAGSSAGELPPFDDETLDGHVDYSSFVKPTCHLGGELKGLVIRYNSPSSPVPTPTGAA